MILVDDRMVRNLRFVFTRYVFEYLCELYGRNNGNTFNSLIVKVTKISLVAGYQIFTI